jgi:hypothetical protein
MPASSAQLASQTLGSILSYTLTGHRLSRLKQKCSIKLPNDRLPGRVINRMFLED